MNNAESRQSLLDQAVVKRKTSIRQLGFAAQDAGYRVVGTTLGRIRAGRYESVPSAETIRAITWLAGVDESVAFESAGQPVPGPPLADELPPDTDNLSPKSRKVVVDMIRVCVGLETDNNEQRTSGPEDSTPRTLRAVSPEEDPRPGQLTEPEYGITELNGDEARSIPVPPRERLTAHPKVKTRAEQLDKETGEYREGPQSAEGAEIE